LTCDDVSTCVRFVQPRDDAPVAERRRGQGRGSLARQLFVLQLVVLAVVVLAGAGLALLDARRDGQDAARGQVLGIAESLAAAPSTRTALAAADPAAQLQPVAEAVRRTSGVDFVVVMAPDRTRYSHPNPDLLGLPFEGTITPALAGQVFTEEYPGTLGPSIRAVAPVQTADGAVVGLVAVGITQEALGRQLVGQLPVFALVVAVALAVATAGSLLLSRRLRRQTLGLRPDELRHTYVHHEAVLHAVGEGLVVVDPDHGISLVNDEARRLLDLHEPDVRVDEMPDSLRELVRSGAEVTDELHLTGARVLLVSQVPATWEGRPLGTVLTLRDHTELQGVLGELDSVRGFAESLRSQAHESANRLHTVITMVELGRTDEAVAFATAELELSQHLVDRLVAAVGEPALAALLLGKVSQAAERGVALTVSEDTAVAADTGLDPRELVTLVGNLLDNACDAAVGATSAVDGEPWVEVSVRTEDGALVVTVADSGPGMSAAALTVATERGRSTKSGHAGLGLALVAQLVARHHGSVRAENSEVSVVTAVLPLGVRSR
jgi:two-component system CitB family sensor kinase